LCPIGLAQYTLDHERVDVDKADLQQVQRQHGEFLVLQIVGRKLTAFAVKDFATNGIASTANKIRKRRAGYRRSGNRGRGVHQRAISKPDPCSERVSELWHIGQSLEAHGYYWRWVTETLLGEAVQIAVRRFFVDAAR
jgi:hypothetical protein